MIGVSKVRTDPHFPLGIYERARGRPIVGLPLWIAVTASIIAAFFSAWRKERLQVESFSQQGRQVRDYLSRSLTVKDKFNRVINDVNHLVPIDRIDEWEVETSIYLREKRERGCCKPFYERNRCSSTSAEK
jgi:hypothetical protein